MKKHHQQHLTYGIILILTIAGILYYQDQQSFETRQIIAQNTHSLLQEIATLQQNLQVVESTLQTELQQLEQKSTALQRDISGLNESLEQKEKSIQGLSGELATVKEQSEEQVAELEDSISRIKSQNQDFSGVIEDSVRAVVSVQTDRGAGSGFIINQDGYVVTNYHVIEGARAATVITHDGTRHRVFIAGHDARADIAVIKINASELSTLNFGDSDDARVGEKVIAIGNPGGLDFTVTQGIISAVNRDDPQGNRYIQIDVPINPGNSGGPLIDTQGRVIGVNTLKLENFEGLGFALTSNYVEGIVSGIIG